MTRGRTRAAALLTVVLLGSCTSEVAGSATAAVPGADGYGDPYYPLDGNGGYDVESYALELRFDPESDTLEGTATVVATATQTLSAFNLDLVGLEVSSVTVDGEDAATDRDEGELTVTPALPLGEGDGFTTVVTYAGVPESLDDGLGDSGFLQTGDGALAVGQPDSAAAWFPVNDHPADAATVEVSIAVPEGLEAVSNGALLGSTTEDGWTTWRWAADQPMAPYLVTLAVGEFRLDEYEEGGIGYVDAVDPALDDQEAAGSETLGSTADAAFSRQPEVLAFLAEWFGPYPFDQAGGIVDDVPDMGFALETQTRPVYAPAFFTDAASAEAVVVHELAHQWAGDSVRVGAWQHIWLNEGFATYAEWLWAEEEGTSTAQEEFDRLAARPAGSSFWQIPIGDPGPDTDRLFSSAVYQRGAMTLHAVRTALGEDDFAELLQEWFGAEAGQAVTTEDFVALAEEVSGQDLDDLFAEWLGEGRPESLG
ncbi:M1 family metallopeptidase [Blastococcus sp. TF02A-26]|uniref:M1 family metallopeptidase n=1 Tax=Blastococcus sp. TF02A-26 TaxID=2250577 RepID=UPI000DEB68EE|nr:M1 family metallopeptidase [Blastococcus sp. TF02A-26]RBY85298.1 M1 family peptidase [Blastococcus sp. TF02A-26]